MEYPQDSSQSQADNQLQAEDERAFLLLDVVGYVIIAMMVLAFLVFLFYNTTSAELTCSRSSPNLTECSLVQRTTLLKMTPITLRDPIAVEVIKQYDGDGGFIYDVKIRTAHPPRTIPILSTNNDQVAQGIADEVNNFLLKSDQASFFGRFP
jgi:hypothetical protein